MFFFIYIHLYYGITLLTFFAARGDKEFSVNTMILASAPGYLLSVPVTNNNEIITTKGKEEAYRHVSLGAPER